MRSLEIPADDDPRVEIVEMPNGETYTRRKRTERDRAAHEDAIRECATRKRRTATHALCTYCAIVAERRAAGEVIP